MGAFIETIFNSGYSGAIPERQIGCCGKLQIKEGSASRALFDG